MAFIKGNHGLSSRDPHLLQEVMMSTVSPLWLLCFACPILFAQSHSPADMSRIGTVDERFQSYNVEMLEVTGGRFWKPYSSTMNSSSAQPKAQSEPTPAGLDPNLYEYRAPIDLSKPRLRKLAAALGRAYVRVSGTWRTASIFTIPMIRHRVLHLRVRKRAHAKRMEECG
jgi:hypothetical protein